MGKMIKERQKEIRDAVKGATKEAAKAMIPPTSNSSHSDPSSHNIHKSTGGEY